MTAAVPREPLPEEVEAFARAAFVRDWPTDEPGTWEKTDAYVRDNYRDAARWAWAYVAEAVSKEAPR